jgi:hypothetical protein
MCACSKTPFTVLKSAGIRTIQEAGEQFLCGVTCRMCVPYIQKMLETGETEFAVIELRATE